MRGIVALVFVAATIAVAAQQDIPRFRSGIDVVHVTVTVLDKDRHPVTGLTVTDFELLVDGKPRPVAAFAAVTLPGDATGAMTAAPVVAPDVQTNQLPPEGRLVVIVIDRSTPGGRPMQAARAVANTAIDRLGPEDLGAVVFTAAGLLKYSQGITADRARLHAAVAEALGGALEEPPLPPSVAAAAAARGAPQRSEPLNRVQLASDELSGECRCGVCVPETLTELARALSGPLIRHKSILFVGSDIAIASTDPSGQWNLFRQSSLAVLPDYTGGRVVLNTNKPADKIGEIFDESRSYYVLAVAREPADEDDDPTLALNSQPEAQNPE